MSTIQERLDEVAEDFKGTTDRREQLELVIEYGEELPKTKKETFTEEDKVPGCVSDVFISAHNSERGTVTFTAFTESLVTKGYVAIIIHILNDLPKEEIINSEEKIANFIKETQLDVSLVPTRTNAFGRVLKFMIEKTS